MRVGKLAHPGRMAANLRGQLWEVTYGIRQPLQSIQNSMYVSASNSFAAYITTARRAHAKR